MKIPSQIIKWYDNKTKLYKKSDLCCLNKYLKNTDQNIVNTIQFSYDYEFDYYDLDKIDCEKVKIRPENIFKINFLAITRKLSKYFSDITIEAKCEVAGENDKEIKLATCTYKHDAYLKVSKPIKNKDNICVNTKFFEIGLEYFESVHDRIKDDDKYISSKVNLDGYYIYYEKNKKKNIDNSNDEYSKYIKETIYSMFVCICALSNDNYTLSKMLYFKNYNKTKSLQKDTQIFNNIISWKKNDTINLVDLMEILAITNPDTEEEFTYDEFIEYVDENYNIKITGKFCNYNIIILIINSINTELSQLILNYRNMYTRTMEVLFESQKELFIWLEKKNESKDLIPDYLRNILRLHIQHYKKKDTLKVVFDSLKDLKLK